MGSQNLRQKFLEFFEKNGHKMVPSSSLLPTDPSVLFTTAGMQQFKEYFLGKESPYGKRVTSCQKCFRTSDIDNVGDASHLTFLEMLGHFSFGDYFKKETIGWTYELLTKIFKISSERISVSVFAGDNKIPIDKESYSVWAELLPKESIRRGPKEDNVWGPPGPEGPCGAANEVYIDGMEVATLVFVEYNYSKDGILAELSQKSVDVGWGLERLAMIVQNKPSVFETDLFFPILAEISGRDEKTKRIIADHIKSSVFLISEGIFPSNVERVYILRRILRRAIRYGKLLDLPQKFLIPLAQKVIETYKDVYPEVKSKEADTLTVIQNEEEKFERTLQEGLKQFEKIAKKDDISGIDAFHLYDTYGFPLELTEELAKEKKIKVDKLRFEKAFKEHQKISRAGAEKKFGGGGEFSPKLHTATHLLNAALRKVLGGHVKQMGSDITPQRLRFDFPHPQKMTEEEIKEVEDLVNQKIKEDLPVVCEEMTLERAKEKGAMGVFENKYGERVKVYSVSEFSKEICGGPHVKKTSELGHFRIVKEESCGANTRRIRAVLE